MMKYDSLFELLDKVPHQEIKYQYLHVLSFITITPDVPIRTFLNSLEEIRSHGDIQVAYTMEDGRFFLHGAATILYETKISHACSKVGHIEDLVVTPNYRNLGIALQLVDILIRKASVTCYKVILHCNEELTPLYEKCGFRKCGSHMENRF
jgi:glucosamine-phosphate N-acetyltransferase